MERTRDLTEIIPFVQMGWASHTQIGSLILECPALSCKRTPSHNPLKSKSSAINWIASSMKLRELTWRQDHSAMHWTTCYNPSLTSHSALSHSAGRTKPAFCFSLQTNQSNRTSHQINKTLEEKKNQASLSRVDTWKRQSPSRWFLCIPPPGQNKGEILRPSEMEKKRNERLR